jgi:hypothetical protein
MKKRVLFRLVCISLLVIAATPLMYANAITGSLPFAGIGVTNSNSTFSLLSPYPTLSAVISVSSGPGTGSFSTVPLLTTFSGFTLDVANIATGGGFAISNSSFGSFVATKGLVITALPTFLNVDLQGIYNAGPGLQPSGSDLVNLNLSFTQNGGSLSASGTLAALPEVDTLLLMGTGILGIATRLRYVQKGKAR